MTASLSTRPWPDILLKELQQAQREKGCISTEQLSRVAEEFGLSLNEVYGVASFYSFLSVRPLGRNVIRACKSVPCYLKQNKIIFDTIQKELGISPGQTTADGRFTFMLTNCVGLCDKPPAMLVNDNPHVYLDPGKIAGILAGYK